MIDDRPLSDEEQAEARQYGRQELFVTLADKALDVAYLTLAALVLAWPIDAWLKRFDLFAADTLRLAALFLIVSALHVLVSLPLSFYGGYVLEHRYQLSKLSLRRWLTKYVKRLALGLAFNLVLLTGLFWLIWLTGPWWWAAAAAATFVVIVLIGRLAPVLILPLFYKVEPLEDEELARRMQRLAEGTGLSIEGVYRLVLGAETVKANAALAGLGSTRRVLVSDTLLDGFTHDEIEVVFAHEIGHHVFKHIRNMIVTGVVFCTAGFFLADRMLALWFGAGYNPHELPVAALPFLLLVLTLLGLLILPVQNAISRRYERQCDRYALERTGMIDAYMSAFRKLARLNKDDPDPHPLEVALLHDHPPIRERLAMAEQMTK